MGRFRKVCTRASISAHRRETWLLLIPSMPMAFSSAPRLIGTPRRRTISAEEVSDGRDEERGVAAERRGATARVWRSGARPRRQDVEAAQDSGRAAAVAG